MFPSLFLLMQIALFKDVKSFPLPQIDHIFPLSVGIDGGVLDVFGERLFPTTTSIWVGEQLCPLIKTNSDPHGRFIACHLPPSNGEMVAKISVRSRDRDVPCENCAVEYQYDLLAQADVTGSHLKGAPGDTLHLLPINDWNLVKHHLQVTSTIGGLSTTPDEYEAIFRQQAGKKKYSDQLHVSIPIGLEAGDYPLKLTIDRGHLHHPKAHGHVRFASNSTPTVRVVPVVTDWRLVPANIPDAVDLEIFGLGFSPESHHNSVVLAGHKCVISRSDYHYIYCSLSPLVVENWNPSPHPTDRGFPLDLTPLKQDSCPQHVVIDEPSITIEKAVSCMTHLEPTERVVLSSEFIFPVPHPLHSKGFRTEQFHAIGEAYLHPPIPGNYTFFVDCSDLRFHHLCKMSLEDSVTGKIWKTREKSQKKDEKNIREYVLGPVFLDGERSHYLLKAEFLHLTHGEQFRLSVNIQTDDNGNNLSFEGVPAEWFSFTHPLPREVDIQVNGFNAVCRPNQPATGCQFPIESIPMHAVAQTAMLKATKKIITQRAARLVHRRLSNVRRRLAPVELSNSGSWSGMISQAGSSTQLTIPKGVTITLDANMDVASLTVRGTLAWDKTKPNLELRAGYILVLESGKFEIGTQASPMMLPATIYIKNNGEEHFELGVRFFAGYIDPDRKSETSDRPTIGIYGRPLKRTWSLLAETAEIGATSIKLDHDANVMGWLNGDRIYITPTYRGSLQGEAEEFHITSISGTTVTLDGSLKLKHIGSAATYMQAEVVNMNRNIEIKGDEIIKFKGLHTVMHTGGVMQITYTKVQDCGQRGDLGRYCLHFHLLQKCPECLFKGNVVENSWQRGIVVHGTHQSNIEDNILYKVRGANLYIEDGNELDNTFTENVAICHDDSDERSDCRIAGTDNENADYKQQSGMWGLSVTNDFIGNRFSHTYNGFFTQTSAFINGKGQAKLKVCPKYGPFGRLKGNANHGAKRFGFYLDKNWPRALNRNYDSDGYVVDIINGAKGNGEWYSCNEFTADGSDNGYPGVIEDGVDFFNNLVGQYQLGDMQWLRFHSINNNHGMYWKSTKNFADGCSAHVKDSVFKTFQGFDGDHGVGLFLGPGGVGSFIFEGTEFGGSAGCAVCANQHCQVAKTGGLCTPEYTFKDCEFNLNANTKKVQFAATGDSYGVPAMFTSFDTSLGVDSTGRTVHSIVHGDQKHLLSWSGGDCIESGADSFDNGIVCTQQVRRLQIWSKPQSIRVQEGLSGSYTTTLRYLEGDDEKQGYGVPILAGEGYEYKINLDKSKLLAIEFSDITYGNHFGNARIDKIQLSINGEACGNGEPKIVNSMHDRHWIGVHGVLQQGGGACGTRPDEPRTIDSACPAIIRGGINGPPVWDIAPLWSACSVTCGSGVQTRHVSCKDADGKTIHESHCIAQDGEVTTTQSCNTGKNCPPQPTASPTTFYSSLGMCGQAGIMAYSQANPGKIKVCEDEKNICRVFEAINSKLNPQTCTSFCEMFSLQCQNAWSDQANDCEQKAEIGCDDADGGTSDHICQCGEPSKEVPPKDECTLPKSCVEGVSGSIDWLLDPVNQNTSGITPEGDTCEWAYRIGIVDNGLTGIHENCDVSTTDKSYEEELWSKCYGAIYEGIDDTKQAQCIKFWDTPSCPSDFVCGYGWTLKNPLPSEPCASPFCTRVECCNEVQDIKQEDLNTRTVGIAKFGENTDTVRGTITFTQEKVGTPAVITFDLVGLQGQVDTYHVHTGAMDPSKLIDGVVDCSYEIVGGHLNPDGASPDQLQYEKGDLSGKFGSLLDKSEAHLPYTDMDFYLTVKDIIGRSVVLHKDDGSSWVCANIKDQSDFQAVTTEQDVMPIWLIAVIIAGSICFCFALLLSLRAIQKKRNSRKGAGYKASPRGATASGWEG